MSDADELELLDVAVEAARAAATTLRARFGRQQAGVKAKSTPTDLVSDADMAADSVIRTVLKQRRPADALLTEEGGASGSGALRWIVDPLDGTINYLFGIPVFAVSIACEDGDGALAGVVLDPIRDELFTATRSGAPMLQGEALSGREGDRELSRCLVATGFAYDAALRKRQAAVLNRVLPRVRDIRRLGAAALDLAWVACGRFDAYYERGLKRWDLAAGELIAARAGLEVRELVATDEDPSGVVVAPASVVDELYGLVVGTDLD